jgi:hypothetical protein
MLGVGDRPLEVHEMPDFDLVTLVVAPYVLYTGMTGLPD